MNNRLREVWDTRRYAIGLWCNSSDSLVVESLVTAHPDFICIDMQHGAAHIGNIVGLLQAMNNSDVTPIVRVDSNAAHTIGKVLDAGAQGVVVPGIESIDDARQAIRACLYPPDGIRSFGPFRASLAGRGEVRDAHDIIVILQIETAKGLANVESICTAKGIDAIYIGPSDLGIALGMIPGSSSTKTFIEAVNTIKTSAESHGLIAGMHTYNSDEGIRRIDEGFRMVTLGVDLRILRECATRYIAEARDHVYDSHLLLDRLT